MPTRVALHHVTSYLYDRPISLGAHSVRLRPAPHTRTRVLGYDLKITPGNHFLNWVQDPFSNYVARLNFPEPTDRLIVDVDLIVELEPINPFDFFLEESAEQFPFQYEPGLASELKPFLDLIEPGPALRKRLEQVPTDPVRTVDFLSSLIVSLSQEIKYLIRMEPGIQSCEETLTSAIGSCRDSAFLLVHMLRHLGLAARFVSGYLIQLAPDEGEERERLSMTEDFTDLHAWAEVYLPGAGWVGLDATSGLFAGEGHIPLAAVPEPGNAAPISGTLEATQTDFRFHMQVSRLQESPRSTRPYSDASWREILRTGLATDKRIAEQGFVLNLGGEPTLTADENRDAPEWNLAALGEHKLALAEKLLLELKDSFAPDGLLQYTQGKWYPGEVLPRWSLNCYWMPGKSLVGREGTQPAQNDRLGELARAVCDQLDLDHGFLIPAYEDVDYYQWRVGQLEGDAADPEDKPDLNDFESRELARARLLRERGFDSVSAYVLPLEFVESSDGWTSCGWELPRDTCRLIPGDSAPGYRLPLNQVGRRELGLKRESAEVFYQSLCLSVRDGRAYFFMPPTRTTEAFLNLVAGIRGALEGFGWTFRLEGYEPPSSPELRTLKVTPDPGVIEVNIHPSVQFRDSVRVHDALYRAAGKVGLVADKFLLDGRSCGTGGGNHITLGGTSFEESPFFKNPLLLKRMICYWQQHPSLSYLFSGLFVGPTSQAPRVDESRGDHLYELELSLAQIRPELSAKPWILDRLLRNYLIDLTGNTHRSEICIDKLFNPDSASGRQGIVELRAFEMPPHHRMASALTVLVRSLVSRLWDRPCDESLVRWGDRLHDQFLLPTFIWDDFVGVVRDLKQHGYPLKTEWYQPFLEFRMPAYGSATLGGKVELELRMALEPWNVLGETGGQGTSRPVDSAIERLEVRLRHFDKERMILACNGYAVPVHQLGSTGEFVGAVRYKAWDPVFTLHPYLPAQDRLVFDLWDKRYERSLGGCTYFVSHPGGLSFDAMPVNHREAESRRLARFQSFGHGRYPKGPPLLRGRRNYYTLDLLKAAVEHSPH